MNTAINPKQDRLFREIFACPTYLGQDMAWDVLARYGYTPQRGTLYTYAPGTIPVCLCAHTDTVHKAPPTKVYRTGETVWAAEGIGADDRAGVYAIASLLRAGLRPHVLFTDMEEKGGLGATDAADNLDAPDVRCLIQIDRRNDRDAVYYDCDAPALERYVTSHGFKTAYGTFTDISILGPAWGIAAVNLSAGYYREHSAAEYLRLDQLARTIGAVANMLRRPPRRRIKYCSAVRRSWLDDDDDMSFWQGGSIVGRALTRPVETEEEEYERLLREHRARGSNTFWDEEE